MPLTTDNKRITLSKDLLDGFRAVFETPPGSRPNHARGVLLTGTFQPSASARTLSSAPHFTEPSTAVTVRFSSATGEPHISDTRPDANPRSLSIRFHLGGRILRRHTDIISHSVDRFLARTGEEFLEFLRAKAAGDAARNAFFATHPAALRFAQIPKPSPSSFARERYYAVHAYKFKNAAGEEKFARYRFTPDAGVEHLDDATTKAKDPDFLFNEIHTRVAPGSVSFKLWAQIAQKGDKVDDATEPWPNDRQVLELGTITLNGFVEDDQKEQKRIIFDPIPRVQGIEPSDDPLLEVRAALYLISGLRRRVAKVPELDQPAE
jgi:catalase